MGFQTWQIGTLDSTLVASKICLHVFVHCQFVLVQEGAFFELGAAKVARKVLLHYRGQSFYTKALAQSITMFFILVLLEIFQCPFFTFALATLECELQLFQCP